MSGAGNNWFDRRELLKGLGATGSAMLASRAVARAIPAPGRFLVVFLRGAYDAVNAVIPIGSDFYYEARPDIAVAQPDPGNPDAAMRLDANWGLHPALRETIGPLWKARQIAFIPFVGSSLTNRSHFSAQDVIELGQPSGAARAYGSGFLGRLAQIVSGARPISFTQALPLCFEGGPTIQNLMLDRVAFDKGLTDAEAAAIAALYASEGEADRRTLDAAAISALTTRRDLVRDVRISMTASNPAQPPAVGFERVGRQMGRLMRDFYNLAFVDLGGWDTHVNQGGAKGIFANQLGQLGRGLAAFVQEVGPSAWRETTVVVLSEFGRTFRQNGDRGTDHGHGSIYWVLGGSIAGGRIAGPQSHIVPDVLHEGRDLPVLTDYRACLADILRHCYGLSAAQLGIVFPGVVPAEIRLG